MDEFGAVVAEPGEVGLDREQLERAHQVLMSAVNAGDVPGGVGLVLRHEKIAALWAEGWACQLPARSEMMTDTLFDLASLTKVVATTPAVMLSVERGVLSLGDRVGEFMAEFARGPKSEVTIKHLLTHTSGLPATGEFYSRAKSRADVLRLLQDVELEYEPGTKCIYSDVGFIVLGLLVEKLWDKPLDEVARAEVFEPLEMGDTGFNPSPDEARRCAATKYCDIRKRVLQGENHNRVTYAMGGVSGHAGLFSTATDLAKYARMWLNKGRYNSARILSAASVETTTANHTASLSNTRGLGWILWPDPMFPGCDLCSPGSYGHTGFTGTSIIIDPRRDLAIVLLTNRTHPIESNGIFALRRHFHNAVLAAVL